ncbi:MULTISPECIES: tyrosine-type recombinase/integrase [unclassified Streptomyces]|uniref:tyrosine-type recombinase/integrase n=1 Tax=unclassified Streptomyces TaxID=2593676 RepID=UPI000978F617|nr:MULTISPECIES: tyrosine-type recombinase/integrase [unclassified Streptomyces]ONI50892.1 putative transposase [Streptomyces sp. IB2014 011-1]RDV49086.1 site-specific integrase [Streptomyces sp. IB2014 011-12]
MAKRRPNGGGTVTRRKDGRYQGAAYVTNTDGHRVRKFVYGSTYDEAAEKLGKLQEQERNGVPVPSRTWSLGEWLAYWLEHIVKPNREHNTYVKYESKVRLYLVPHLGKKPLVRLTPAQLRSFMAELKRTEVPPAARFEVLRVLRNALNRAVREELLTRNVAELVDMPKVTKKEAKPWNAREAITFLRSARAHRLYAACVLVLVLGLRRSEVLGLRWQDIDFDQRQFTPLKQVQRVKGVGLVLKDLKTESSHAVLPLPEFCARALEERRKLQDLERRIVGDGWSQEPGQDLIFSSERGGLIDPVGFSRSFNALVKRAGVRRITVRLARHTCGTLLAFLKVHPKVAQAILRHSQISMTMDVYTHVVGDGEREAVTMLAELLEDPLIG